MPSEKFAPDDATAALVVRQALADGPSVGVTVERAFHHEERGWLLFEFLQLGGPYTSPPYKWRDLLEVHESHPNNYWDRIGRRFVSLWAVARALDATLYLVNYAVRETDAAADVPADRVAQPHVRLPPDGGAEERVYYYVAREKGVHVTEVIDVDTDADVDDPGASPIETRPIDESRGGMQWTAFGEWFGELVRACDAGPQTE